MPAICALSRRILSRLAQAEAREPDPWLSDDLEVARLTVLYAASGEAVCCSPQVLASYEVLGLHPDKVWPAIEARRKAMGPLEVIGAPPKKPAQSVKLWCEKSESARVVNSRADVTVLREPTISVPMAAPSIAALYPNSDAPPSAKKGGHTYDEILLLLKRRGASHSVRELIRDAIVVRSRWPKEQGAVSAVLTVSVKSLENESGLWRSTIQRRLRRAQKELCLRQTRDMNSWLNCPKCGTARQTAKCPKCPHKGNGFDHKEFRRTFTYEIDFGHLERLAHCRGQITEIPRNPAPPPQDDPPPQNDPPPKSPAPVVSPQPQRQNPAAEHHRSNQPQAGISRAEERAWKRRQAVKSMVDHLIAKKSLAQGDAVTETMRSLSLTREEVESDLAAIAYQPPQAEPPPKYARPCEYVPDERNPWKKILAALKAKINVHSFETWLQPTRYDHMEADVLYVRVPTAEFAHAGYKFADLIQGAIEGLGLEISDVKFVTGEA